MSILRFARVACFGVVVLAAVVAAGPVSGRVVGFEDPGGAAPATSGNWQVATTPNPGGWGNIVWGVSALNQRDAWAVGVQATFTSNDPLALHWNGADWSTVPTPTPVPDCEDGNIQWNGNSLNAVDAASANDVWAVGNTCYGLSTLIEHWNGSTWSIVPGASLARGDQEATLSGVAVISSSNAWAVGYRSSGTREALIEHWNGSTWTEVPGARLAGSDSYLTAVAATGPSNVWAIGSANGLPLVEHFNGTSWARISTPQPAGASLDAISVLSPTDVWVVGWQRASAHLTLTMHFDGSGWTVVPSPNISTAFDADNELRAVAAAGRDDVWAVGMFQNQQTSIHQHRTLALHWDGTSWTIGSSPSPGHSSELFAAATPMRQSGPLDGPRVFAGGVYSLYDINIYDGTYTDPRTLVMSTN